MTRLIVNADGFGQTAGIDRAVLELHEAGVITSATLIARTQATDQAVEIALATPTLGVGCHIVLTDGEPVLQPARIPSLLDRSTGLFIPELTGFVGRLLTGRIRPKKSRPKRRPRSKPCCHEAFASLTSTRINTHTCFPVCCVPFSAGRALSAGHPDLERFKIINEYVGGTTTN